MSTTIAHRHHVQVPLAPILAVIVTVLVAVTVIWVINRPASTATETQAVPVPLAAAAAVPLPETPVVRRQLEEAYVGADGAEPFAYPRNHVRGVTLDMVFVFARPFVGASGGSARHER